MLLSCVVGCSQPRNRVTVLYFFLDDILFIFNRIPEFHAGIESEALLAFHPSDTVRYGHRDPTRYGDHFQVIGRL